METHFQLFHFHSCRERAAHSSGNNVVCSGQPPGPAVLTLALAVLILSCLYTLKCLCWLLIWHNLDTFNHSWRKVFKANLLFKKIFSYKMAFSQRNILFFLESEVSTMSASTWYYTTLQLSYPKLLFLPIHSPILSNRPPTPDRQGNHQLGMNTGECRTLQNMESIG